MGVFGLVFGACALGGGTVEEQIESMYLAAEVAFPGLPSITAEELIRIRAEERPVVVDIREPQERAVSVIPGAITRSEFESRKVEVVGRKIVVYCTVGVRSGRYGKQLQSEGFDVANLRGSLLAWTFAGGDLVDPSGEPTKRLHVYGRRWALVAPGYEAVW